MPGKVIKHLRSQKNYSQEYMAKRLNMSIGNYSRLENDQLPISIERLHIIAEALQVKPHALISRLPHQQVEAYNITLPANTPSPPSYTLLPSSTSCVLFVD